MRQITDFGHGRCAGICELVKDEQGKYRRILLKLSEALLKYRARDDTVNTLLHEAIHAYFFITSVWRKSTDSDELDRSGHGTGFQILASAINQHGGYDISIYHTFHDEVESYRTHIWQCDGPCRSQAPFFGLVKRSMNRPPSNRDSWWQKHQTECGGTYTKISEPDLTKEQVKALSARERAGRQTNKLDSWIRRSVRPMTNSVEPQGVDEDAEDHKAGSIHPHEPQKRRVSIDTRDPRKPKKLMVFCPICDVPVDEHDINTHLDAQHAS
ncbi:hypothetical protein EJ05DRAFT_472908 [Pseudovirgaria hyperparasitica]|uniref:SprT-like domain-containing protein n=1 Tax=Pseudovirgaria hyperparasitica TaxID=470096 RepID=A0A6A6WIJ7_9PEZI|nr:uncharacterized protein EJ05DRAFT_472908 [Pseudovirgaria hyperparasitica]KAF2761965.1 hypothetical protein EJ05DRAFT_472908 [Pseudovirgaria hyperparasitica]